MTRSATLGKTEVELRIYSIRNKENLMKRFFRRTLWVSSALLEQLLRIGTTVSPVAKGLKEGLVTRVTDRERKPKVWAETQSYDCDLDDLDKDWEKVSCE